MSISKLGDTGIKVTGPIRVRTDKEIIMYLTIQYALHEVLIKRLEKKVEKLEKENA